MNAVDHGREEACAEVRAGPSPTAWLRIALRVALFSGVVGLLLGLMDPSKGAMVEALVYSESIGLAINGVYAVLRIWVMPRRRPVAIFDYVIRGIVAIPVGFVVGFNVAGLLMGNPVGLGAIAQTGKLAIPVTVLASLCLMYYFWSSNRIADAAAAYADAQRTMAEAKLKLLQAQIEPHMLFNTLANLRTLVEVDPARAQTMLDQLIVYLRGTLAASRAVTTTLEHEFAHLTAYLELMQVRMASRLRIAIDLPTALRPSAIPPMLLQPLVENAIRHGLEPKIEGGTVRIVASVVDDRLRVEVIDDGIGLVDPTEVDSASYGVAHVRERLRTLYGDAAHLVIEAGPGGGVCARVELPR